MEWEPQTTNLPLIITLTPTVSTASRCKPASVDNKPHMLYDMHNDVHTSSLEATLTTALSTIQARSRMILCLIMTHSCSACPLYRVSIRPDPAQFSALGITALSHDAFATGTCCSHVIIIHLSPGADGICLFAMLIYFASANVYMHKMYMSSSVS